MNQYFAVYVCHLGSHYRIAPERTLPKAYNTARAIS